MAHDHSVHVPGCFRCELSRDEVIPAMGLEIEDLEAENERLQGLLRTALDEHCGCLPDRWCEDDDQPMNDCVWPTSECMKPAESQS